MTGRDAFNLAGLVALVVVLLACFGNWDAW